MGCSQSTVAARSSSPVQTMCATQATLDIVTAAAVARAQPQCSAMSPELVISKPVEQFEIEAGTLYPIVPLKQADQTIIQALPQAQPWDPKRFTRERKLEDASRNEGVVELMRDAEAGGGFVAVKRMPLSWTCKNSSAFDQAYPKSSERPWFDIAIINFLNEENCAFACSLGGVFVDGPNLRVATTFANGGDLFDWSAAVKPKTGPEREEVMKPVIRQLASAVRTLHDHGICHRDISLENVLIHKEVDGALCVKLIDFGMATFQRDHVDQERGKFSYQAPEMHRGKGAYDGFLSDAFALGVVLFCVTVKDYPWLSTKPNSCKNFDFASKYGLTKWLSMRKVPKLNLPVSSALSDPLKQLVLGLLDFDPATRFALGEHAWRVQSPAVTPRKSVWNMEWLVDEDAQKKPVTDTVSDASTDVGAGGPSPWPSGQTGQSSYSRRTSPGSCST